MKIHSLIFFTYLLIVVLLFGSCGERGNENIIEMSKDLKPFHAIKVGGGFTVYLKEGQKESITIEADENLHDIIRTEVKKGILDIYTEKNIYSYKALNIFITFRNLEEITLNGGVDLIGESLLKSKKLTLEMNGGTTLDLKIKVSELKAELNGGATANVKGKAERILSEVSGGGSFNAEDLSTNTCFLSVSGGGSAYTRVKKLLNANISGGGSVYYKGNPKVKENISGGGSINKLD